MGKKQHTGTQTEFMNAKRKRKPHFSSLAILLLCAGTLFAGYEIGKELLTRQKAKAEYDDTIEKHISQKDDTKEDHADDLPSWIPDIDIDHTGLFLDNSDYIGWIYYEDGNISYPICKSTEEDPSFYLTHTFLKESNPSGCVFIDYDKDENFELRTNYMFGHNMASGAMFGSLKRIYNKLDEYLQNPYFYLFLKNGFVKRYRVFSLYVTDKSDEAAFDMVDTKEEERSYIQNALSKGTVKGYAPFDVNEEELLSSGESPLVILITCYGRAGTSKRLLTTGVETDSAYVPRR